jgi:hypothetical protein
LLRGRSGIVTARAPGRQAIIGRDEIPVSSADQIDGRFCGVDRLQITSYVSSPQQKPLGGYGKDTQKWA